MFFNFEGKLPYKTLFYVSIATQKVILHGFHWIKFIFYKFKIYFTDHCKYKARTFKQMYKFHPCL